jgi:hypothetical protein
MTQRQHAQADADHRAGHDARQHPRQEDGSRYQRRAQQRHHAQPDA